MGRKSRSIERRKEIVAAFARELADHGYSGATIVGIAARAELAPGLIHHYFSNKQEILGELFTTLLNDFRAKPTGPGDPLVHYINAALRLDDRSDTVMAKCWVGILSEALRDPILFERLKRHLDGEIRFLTKLSEGRLDSKKSAGILAFILGSLVFGAFAPNKTTGFAADVGVSLLNKLIDSSSK